MYYPSSLITHTCYLQMLRFLLCFVLPTVFNLRTGDVFNGIHSHTGCLDIDDHTATLVIGGVLGNGVRASIVTEMDGKIQQWSKRGIYDVKRRQLVLESTADVADKWTYVCTFSRDGDQGSCKASRNGLQEVCGSLSLQRDRTRETSFFAHQLGKS